MTDPDLDVLEASVELAQDPSSSADERFDAHHTLLRDVSGFQRLVHGCAGWLSPTMCNAEQG